MSNKVIPVRVAVRCRPLIEKEQNEGCCECIEFVQDEPQLTVGNNKTFTYDYVFSPTTTHSDVYTAVKPLIKGLFKGYNATVLAYGQTGSGKTYTMGGGFYDAGEGVIPRVMKDIFSGIRDRTDDTFTLKVSYLEIYKEELIDLLVDPSKREKESVTIREDPPNGIKLTGLLEQVVSDGSSMLECLERGSQGRTTGATAMNTRSSRSHAIFTIHMERVSTTDENDSYKAKFHLVDLAGSERAKKTRAQGDRLKEGININMGLLALGNVISALGDEQSKRAHIPYRDSKLTRILQDSLGGNSHTLMIACVSPADSNMEETVTTLRYADRARKIKNKPIVNRDPHAAEVMRLKAVIQQLQSQMGSIDRSIATSHFTVADSKLSEEITKLREYVKKLEEESHTLSAELQASLEQNANLIQKVILAEMERDNFKEKLQKLKDQARLTESILNATGDADTNEQTKEQLKMLQTLQETITELEQSKADALKSMLEEQVESSTPLASPTSSHLNAGDSHDDEDNDNDADKHKQHLMKQAKLGRELDQLNNMLERKQQLVQQMNVNDETISAIKAEYEKTTTVLEKEVDQLQKERDELTNQLNSKKSNKVSEQRRLKLKELEGKISVLNKKILEQNKMLKVKESTDKQLQKLNSEIQSMKQQRVKLMKHMKEDAETFRKWKQQKDKELIQLKAKDLKRQAEFNKMERKHAQTSTVLKRKADEAQAANKRLKEALARQKIAQADRMKKQDRHEMGIKDRIKKFLREELDVVVSVTEARQQLNTMIEDRKLLHKHLAELNHEYSLTDNPKVKQEIDELQTDIELRNTQISDIQQRLMDVDQEEKNKQRWNNIHTMSEAKCALRNLMDMAVGAKVAASNQRSNTADVREIRENMMKALDEQTERFNQYKEEKEAEILAIRQECEAKVLYMLNELKGAPMGTSGQGRKSEESRRINERMRFQQQEIEKLAESHEQLQQKATEVDALKRELTLAKYTEHNVSLMPDLDAPEGSSPFIGKILNMKRKTFCQKPSALVRGHKETASEDSYEDDENFTDSSMDDDLDEDPDWQKGLTPNVHRPAVRRTKRVTNVVAGTAATNSVPASFLPPHSAKDPEIENDRNKQGASTSGNLNLTFDSSKGSAADTTFLISNSSQESSANSDMTQTSVNTTAMHRNNTRGSAGSRKRSSRGVGTANSSAEEASEEERKPRRKSRKLNNGKEKMKPPAGKAKKSSAVEKENERKELFFSSDSDMDSVMSSSLHKKSHRHTQSRNVGNTNRYFSSLKN